MGAISSPDAGVYAYSGNDRTKFAATVNHNTLTVMSKSIGGKQGGKVEGKLLKLETKNNDKRSFYTDIWPFNFFITFYPPR